MTHLILDHEPVSDGSAVHVADNGNETSNGNGASESAEIEAPVTFEESLSTVGESLAEMWGDFLARLPLIAVGILALVVTWIVAKIVDRIFRSWLRRTKLGTSLQDLVRQLATIGVWVTGLMIAAIVVFPGMTPAKVLTVLGLGSIAIGFAFKDIVENFVAGVLLLWRFPFDPGDFIESEGLMGRVEEITIRMTKIRQTSGELVVLPNAMLFKSPVNILTDRDTRRVTVICGVAYDEDVDQSREVIHEAVKSCESVAKNQPIEIFAQEFASSSINFEVTWWTGATPLDIRKSRDQVVAKVKRALDEAGIEIPFPYRTLTFKESLEVRGNDKSANGD